MLCLFNQRIKIETTEVIGLVARSPYWRQRITTEGGNTAKQTDIQMLSVMCVVNRFQLLFSANVSRHSPNLIFL